VVGEGAQVASSLVLDQFCRNLTQSAREGKLDRVIGREKEIERVMQVLSRRTKSVLSGLSRSTLPTAQQP